MKQYFFIILIFIPKLLYGAYVEENRCNEKKILNVAIIGSGQSGLSLYFALQKRGLSDIALFDSAPESLEGPWLTTARMHVLRSKKDGWTGPGLGMPQLGFITWYQARYSNWETLDKIPTGVWAEYLQWYKRFLEIPVHNEWHLEAIHHEDGLFSLYFNKERVVQARKIVLATGRSGFGGYSLPSYAQNLPKECYFHTAEEIDVRVFQDKKVCIIGSQASAYDIAAVALESGAERVDMFMKRESLPQVNMWALFTHWENFFYMSDHERASFFQKALDNGTPVPQEAIKRMESWKNFYLHPQTNVQHISLEKPLLLRTNKGTLQTDLLIFATGFKVDLFSIPYLFSFRDSILLWKDKLSGLSTKLQQFPYLGKHFEFLEKPHHTAPFLKNIHCFNYGAFLSHGRIAGDIDQMSFGIERLAEGIVKDLQEVRLD